MVILGGLTSRQGLSMGQIRAGSLIGREPIAVVIVVDRDVVIAWMAICTCSRRSLSLMEETVGQVRWGSRTFLYNARHEHRRGQVVVFQFCEIFVALFHFKPLIQN